MWKKVNLSKDKDLVQTPPIHDPKPSSKNQIAAPRFKNTAAFSNSESISGGTLGKKEKPVQKQVADEYTIEFDSFNLHNSKPKEPPRN